MAESVDKLKDQLSGLKEKYEKIEEINKGLNERLLELYLLYQISVTLSKSLDLEDILRSIRSLFKKTFNVDQYSLMLLDDTSDQLHIKSSYGIPRNLIRNQYYEYGENIFGKALENQKVIYIPYLSKNREYNYYNSQIQYDQGSFLTIPIKPETGPPIGIINLYRKQNNSFSNQERTLLSKIAEQIGKVIEKTLIYKHTKELSITDELTGLYNRRYLNQRLEREVVRAKRYKRPLTAIMIDIDYFKNFNDLNGHLLGDEILKKVAVILENNIRKADILARYGGEEFILLLPEITKSQAFRVAEKLRQTVESAHFPEEHNQPNNRITISLGIATLLEDTFSAEELLDFADKALYEAKKLGRNQVVGYHSDLNGRSNKRVLSMTSYASASVK
ncbi:diguanylate cyclase [candidate division KSB1 bacterium]|nr:diguanylate cyclase [candidate division KSB1 bacterium]